MWGALPKISQKFLTGVSSSGSMKIRSFVNNSPITFCTSLSKMGMREYPVLKILDMVSKFSLSSTLIMNVFSSGVITSCTATS